MTTPIIYEDLTEDQLDFIIINDCGNSWLNVPEFDFIETCWRHDVDYWVGGTSNDRHLADKIFLSRMKSVVYLFPWYHWKRYFLMSVAYIYYFAIRLGGAGSFHDGKRSLEDLEELMNADSNLF